MEATPEPEMPSPPTTTTIPSADLPAAPPPPFEPISQEPPSPRQSEPEPQQEPTPPPTPSHSPRVPMPSSLQKFRRLLLSSALCTDTTLTRLSHLLSTPAGTDSLLCTLSYLLTLLHPFLNTLLTRRLHSLAVVIATKADGVLLPGETLITTFEAPLPTKLLASSAAGSKALAGMISDYRIFVRLWGLLGMYGWGKGVWAMPKPTSGKEKVLRAVAYAQVAACTAYQVLENGAYLASKGVLATEGWMGEEGKRRQARWWVWSSRFWALHVGLEGVRLGTEWWGREDGAKGKKEDGEGKKAEERWWRDVVSNAAYAPLTVHWSTEEGVLSETAVGLLGTVAGSVGLLQNWRATA